MPHDHPVPDALPTSVTPTGRVSVTCTAPVVPTLPWLATAIWNVYCVPDDPVSVLVTPGSG